MMNNEIENERTFLVATMPPLSATTSANIEQHYISESPEPLRIRSSDGAYEITKKLNIAPGDKSRKMEINTPLTEDEFNSLKSRALRSIEKTRHFLPLADELTADLDVFHGPLEGLVWVEVEFPNEESRLNFSPPPWFGKEITDEHWSSNSFIAGKTYAEVQGLID